MLNKLLSFLYVKVFVNIVIAKSKTTIYIESVSSKGLVESSEKQFEVKYLNKEIQTYVESFTKETPFFYISVLDHSKSQGAIPTCAKNQLGSFQDLSSSEHKCYNKKWSFYTAKSDLYAIEKVYDKIGVDFIFSTYVILANFFKDKISSHLAMFILLEEESLSLSIFQDSELLYAEHLDLNFEMKSEVLEIEDNNLEDLSLEEESVDLDSIDLDDIDSLDDIDELDDFGDIEDLDAIEEISEFDDTKDLEEELTINEEEGAFPVEDVDDLNEDYQRFTLIQESVDKFYKDDRFSSEFIENIYIADSITVSGDFKKYLEEEMFVNVYVRRIDLCVELCKVAKMELS